MLGPSGLQPTSTGYCKSCSQRTGCDAMGGRIVIDTSGVVVSDLEVGLHDTIPAGQYALLKIADTGEGIPPENIHRIFDPFFTTKSKERGTGLGLAMAYGTVTQSGGHIRVKSSPNTGTTFCMYLPLISHLLWKNPREKAACGKVARCWERYSWLTMRRRFEVQFEHFWKGADWRLKKPRTDRGAPEGSRVGRVTGSRYHRCGDARYLRNGACIRPEEKTLGSSSGLHVRLCGRGARARLVQSSGLCAKAIQPRHAYQGSSTGWQMS